MSNLINPYQFVTSISGSTWNPADMSSTGISLSNANLTATTTSGSRNVRGTLYNVSGKFYVEHTCDSIGTPDYYVVGFRRSITLIDSYGSDSQRVSLNCSGTISSGVIGTVSLGFSFATSDVICFAIDITTGKIWIRKNGGSWTGNPEAGTGGYSIDNASFAPWWSSVSGAQAITSNFAGPFLYSVPAGFSPWS